MTKATIRILKKQDNLKMDSQMHIGKALHRMTVSMYGSY